jgi:preprotein translocase subunit SecF
MFDITGKRFWFFLISGVIILIGVISLLSFGRLNAGIEFGSGSLTAVSFELEVEQDELNQELAILGYPNAIVQRTGEGSFLIRTDELSSEEKTQLEAGLMDRFGALNETEFSSVSPMIAEETVRNAAIAVAVAAVGILLYITWAFRRMPKPFHYGTCALIALAHDMLVVLGIFSIISSITSWEINLMFITGVLAVIGYSVNNTVVIFDRVRENLSRGVSANFEVVVNNSLVETMGRSLNTSLTTLLVVLALLLFVGASIQNFSVVLLIGVIAGTYSSICIAPQLLLVWERGEWRRFLPWLLRPVPETKGR